MPTYYYRVGLVPQASRSHQKEWSVKTDTEWGISALFILLPEGIKWLWASWSGYQLALSWLIWVSTGSELVDLLRTAWSPPKNCINSCLAPRSLSVLSDWPKLQQMNSSLGNLCQVYAQNGCQSLIAWPLATQNGCQSLIAWPLPTQNGCQSYFLCHFWSTTL